LHDLVLKARDPDGTRLALGIFGDVDSPNGLVAPLLAAKTLVQGLKVALQILSIALLGDAVDADGRIWPLAIIRPSQRFHINQVGQRVELAMRLTPRSFRYPQESR